MKKTLHIFMALLILTSAAGVATAQVKQQKCPTCGKPYSQCSYHFNHPKQKKEKTQKQTGTQKQKESSRSSYLQPEKMQLGWYYACFCWNYDKLTDAKDMCRHLNENGCSVQLMACDSEYGLYYTICFKKSKSIEDIRDFIKTYPSKEVYVCFNIYDGKTNIGRD